MIYKLVLLDRKGNTSPAFACEIHCDGTEIEVDAELAYEYMNSSYKIYILEKDEIISEHMLLGYNFCGDTIINGVNASRSGQYILTVSAAI